MPEAHQGPSVSYNLRKGENDREKRVVTPTSKVRRSVKELDIVAATAQLKEVVDSSEASTDDKDIKVLIGSRNSAHGCCCSSLACSGLEVWWW